VTLRPGADGGFQSCLGVGQKRRRRLNGSSSPSSPTPPGTAPETLESIDETIQCHRTLQAEQKKLESIISLGPEQ
jgi:hypothetical protein